jgi:hypothetical protein
MVSAEFLMLENVKIGLIAYFVKIVHVELSDEWWEIAMSEINWKYFFFKLFNIFYNKRCAIEIPLDYIVIFIILNRKIMYL